MKFLKVLSLLTAINMGSCFGSNLEKYKAFAEKEISGNIESIRSVMMESIKKYKLNEETIRTHLANASKLLHELADIVMKVDEKQRYEKMDEKLTEIHKHVNNHDFDGAMWSYLSYNVYWAEWKLLDTDNEYGLLVDPEHELIKPHLEDLESFFEEDSDD